MTLVALVAVAAALQTMTIHVNPYAETGGDGTRARPFRTLQAALDRAKPGHRVELDEGNYPVSEPTVLRNGGQPGQWLVIAAAKGQRPILDGTKFEPSAPSNDWLESAILDLRGAKYVRIEGLTVFRSPAAGIKIREGCDHIDLVGNKVDTTFGPGLALWNSTHVRALGNEITNANTQDMRLFGDHKNEAPHEALSVAGIAGFEVAFNHVHHCTKEGIDVKEISRDGVVHHNWVHDVLRQGLYVDAWFGELRKVSVESNLVEDAEWGMVLSAEGRDSAARDIAFRNNVVVRTRGSGFFFGTWGGDGPRERIAIESNTFVHTGQPRHWSGATGGIDLRSSKPTEVSVVRNLVVDAPTYALAFASDRAAHIRIEGNVSTRSDSVRSDKGLYGEVQSFAGAGLAARPVELDAGYRARRQDAGAHFEPSGRLKAVASPPWTSAFLPYAPNAPHYPILIRP